jgi:SAM-dependent methyltransferase/aminoglycoside phosphotransferase (APT) family kinase protein
MNRNDERPEGGVAPRATGAGPADKKPRNVRCQYAHFDPATLQPLNEATMRRALEVGFERTDFAGKTVLDIGCHSGFLSFLAAKRGARSVKAYDVSKVFVDELNTAVEINGLPVVGAIKPFNRLDPDVDAADVVLFFEVIHWLVSQGDTIPSVIQKVAALTRECLFFEFPWDVTEPSIQAQTRLTREEYDSSIMFRELCRYFETVTVRQFMTYFGTGGPSVRALVRASGKKKTAVLLPHLPDLTGLEIKLAWGRGNSTYLEGRSRSYLAKVPARESPLRNVDVRLLTKLLDELHQTAPSLLLLPEKLGETYLQVDAHGVPFLVFEWIGLPPFGDCPTLKIPMPRMLEIATELTRELARVRPELIAHLRGSSLRKRLTRTGFERYLRESAPLTQLADEDIDPWLRLAETLDDGSYSHLCHGDLHTSNLVGSPEAPRVVDLDNLMLGSPYTDVASVLAGRAAPVGELAEGFARLSQDLSLERPRRSDVLFPIYQSLGWLSVVVPRLESEGEDLKRLAEGRVRGLRSLLEYGSTLPD